VTTRSLLQLFEREMAASQPTACCAAHAVTVKA
jgi:hypothetical protein